LVLGELFLRVIFKELKRGHQLSNKVNNYSFKSERVPWQRTISLAFIIILAISVFACNDSFEPLKENNNAFFSMYGFLDASADTQWVRIAPVRDQIEMTADTPDVQVTLEDVETGNTVVMNDSLSQLRNGVNILNFWTTQDIELGGSYRLEAERSDEASSSVTITIPESVPSLKIFYGGNNGCSARVNILNEEPLADVQTVWHVRIQSGDFIRKRTVRFSHRSGADDLSPESYRILLNILRERGDLLLPAGKKEITGIDIFAASGGPDWIEDISSIDDLEYALPDGLSNVDNGLGYVIGIASTTIPYERCN
jgi:hypothetical protein